MENKMKITKIAQMSPSGGRKIKIILIGGKGVVKKIHILPDQGLGSSCHDIVDALNPGVAIGGQTWNDDPPDDVETEDQYQQARF